VNKYPLVFLPGLAGTASEFAALHAHFADRRDVESLDPLAGGDLTVDGQARQLAQGRGWSRPADISESAPESSAIVVGHSHGGLVALSLASQFPDRVAGLVLLDTPVLLPGAARGLARLPLTLLRTRAAHRLMRRFFSATFRDADSEVWREEVLGRLAQTPRPVLRAVVHGTFTYNSRKQLQHLADRGVPVLVIRANIPTPIEKLPPGIDTASIDGLGHWPHVHDPASTIAVLEKFLDARD
jgi:pimeloyl-ACP methyl ester carboxylesterase